MFSFVMLAGMGAGAQQPDAGVAELLERYQSAWNKGDAKALAALYTEKAIRIAGYAEPLAGRASIEQSFAKNFAGPWKGTTLTIRPERTEALAPDARLQEGTYQLTGLGSEPQRGRYLNTLVREAGQWKHAGVALIPFTAPADGVSRVRDGLHDLVINEIAVHRRDGDRSIVPASESREHIRSARLPERDDADTRARNMPQEHLNTALVGHRPTAGVRVPASASR
jgi:uncharacterized protein (TIGR02246 family)